MIINPGANGENSLNLTGTTDQVVGFDANGKPAPVSKEDLRGPKGDKGYIGATGPTTGSWPGWMRPISGR